MQYTQYLQDNYWKKLPTADFRARFFLETFVEKLSVYTPHFAQARLMNVFSSCEEALSYIDEYRRNEKNSGYILTALDEISSCLGGDEVASSMFKHIDEPRQNLFKKLRNKELTASNLTQFSVICKAIISSKDEYVKKLKSELKVSLFSDADLKNKERIATRIYSLTGAYITLLLNMGYSPTYLFNRADQFTRPNKYQGRNFEQQFDLIFERLQNSATTFEVYYAIKISEPESISGSNNPLGAEFLAALPEIIPAIHSQKLSADFAPNVFAKLTITTTDYITASWRAKDNLEKLLEAASALAAHPEISISSHSLSIWQAAGIVQTKTPNINDLLGFITSENGAHSKTSVSDVLSAIPKLEEEGAERLARSFRYLRIARESVSLEQKIMNLWISLESIFSDGESSILENILDHVPKIYSTLSLTRRIRHLRELLIHAKAPLTPLAARKIDLKGDAFIEDISDAQMFKIVTCDAASIELFESLEPKEHLRFKLKVANLEFKSNKAIAQRVERTELDVARQIRRIYFVRNKITHSGHYQSIRPQLAIHLMDYLACCYIAIIEASKATDSLSRHSVAELLSSYRIGADAVLSRAKSNVPITEILDITPLPVI
jgi:hypothetical protein